MTHFRHECRGCKYNNCDEIKLLVCPDCSSNDITNEEVTMNRDKKRIFVFSGKQGSGKTTYAGYLKKFIGHDHCKIFKFAEVIYKLHDACLPILKEYGVVSQDVEKEGDLLQVHGTEYGRKCKGENIWVDVTRRSIDKYLLEHSKNYVIVDDCRFENEFNAFHPVAHMVRLIAPREVRKERCSSWRENENHASEIGLDAYEAAGNFDCIIPTDNENSPGFQLNLLLNSLNINFNDEII